MTNHEVILNEINRTKKYSYDDLISIANEHLKKTSTAGKEYATLKFIQNYCDLLSNIHVNTIVREGDPRIVLNKNNLKKCKFQLRNNIIANTDKSSASINAKQEIQLKVKNHTNQSNTKKLAIKKHDDKACCDKEIFKNITKDFRTWLIEALHNFDHEWVARSAPHKSGMRKGTTWRCTSIFSAYQQYIWPASIKDLKWNGRFFDETEACLKKLRDDLENSINDDNGDQARKVCRQIFEWGGVDDDNRKNVSPHIKINIPASDLTQHLDDTRIHLNDLLINGCSNSINKRYEDSNGHQILLDSGSTKIYSLICDNFIIYDGRVSSALGYLVKRWWEACKMQEDQSPLLYEGIPQCLRFSYDKSNKHRNPNPKNINKKIFNGLSNDGTRRIRENIQASWLLHQLLDDDEKQSDAKKSGFSYIKNKQTRLRALEAAIFMIGYHVH